MKKILTIIAIVNSFTVSAQMKKYVAASVSVTNGNNLSNASYFMTEFGVTKGDIAVGLGLGRSSFNFSSKDAASNYFFEPKASFTLVEKGALKGYGVLGIGSYFSNRFFVEYGAGTTISMKNFDFSFQFSNWDTQNYVSLGISRCF